MQLNPDQDLSSRAVAILRDMVPVPLPVEIGEADVRRLALGVADASARRLGARAILAQPDLGQRLLRMRAGVRDQFGGAEGSGVGESLLRLAVFEGEFEIEDARAVFPARFAADEPILRLAEASWIRSAERGYRVPAGFGARALPLDAEGQDAGWGPRFVSLYVEKAKRLDRTIAEGRWLEGSATLQRILPNLRLAWVRADRLGMDEAVASLSESLAGPLMELGAGADLGSLAEVGYRAAQTLERPELRARLLSMQGVVASRQGDSERAKALWTERLRIFQALGDRAKEVDAMLDLAGQAYDDQDFETWNDGIEAAWPIAVDSGQADLVATIWAMRALESLRVDDLSAATKHAQRAIGVLSGAGGADLGLFVSTSAAQTLVKCGRSWEAIEELANVLLRSIEGGRAVHAAIALKGIGRAMDALGRADLSLRCFEIELNIHRTVGTQHIGIVESRIAGLRGRHPELSSPAGDDSIPWEVAAHAILAEIFETRPFKVEAR